MVNVRFIRPQKWAKGDKVKSDEDATMMISRYSSGLGEMNTLIDMFNHNGYLHIIRPKVELIMWNAKKVDDKGNKLVEEQNAQETELTHIKCNNL